MAKESPPTLILKNKKAYFDYEVLDTFEAGIKLKGYEIKAIRDHRLNFKGSFISVWHGEAFLEKMHIGLYKHAVIPDHNPLRRRKLLLKKKEISKIAGFLGQKGFTIVPLEVYLKNHLAKVKIGIGRGKKKYDKRESIKKKEQDRELAKTLKSRVRRN